METLGRITFFPRGVVFPDCEHCRTFIWHHPGGRCLYTPLVFQPSRFGVMLSLETGRCYSGFAKGPDGWEVNNFNHVAESGEIILWVNYLMELGWRP